MFGKKIKIDKTLYLKVEKYAHLAGYSSVDEFLRHVLEKEIEKIEDGASEDDVKNRLRGLGYIS